MKLITLTLGIGILFLQTVKSQDTLEKPRQYNITVKPVKGIHTGAVKGFLATIQDSSLYISQTKVRLNFATSEVAYLQRVDYKSVNSAKLYNRSQKGVIFLVSILTGIAAGALIGYAQGDDSGWFALNAGEKAFVGGLIGAGAGSAIGGIIASSTEKKFLINGEWKNLQEMKESLQNNK